MTETAPPAANPLQAILTRAVRVEPAEIAGLLLSFGYFFAVLCAYYILRPVRDEMGVTVGRDALQTLFVIVFVVMLGAVPLYGTVASRMPRRLIVPIIYLFFVANLVVFWLLFRAGVHGPQVAGAFFVWTSVFNLFAVSLFWITMSDLWSSDQAKRIYGFIAAGGSAGALAGPLITQSLVRHVGTTNLLLVSAALLAVATWMAVTLRSLVARREKRADEHLSVGRGILAGAVAVWKSSYLFRIAMWVLLANLVGTFFYLEQSRIVGETMPDRTARVELFARLDLAVSVLTILAQLFVTSRVLERFGVGVAAAALPVWAAIGLGALAISPTLAVVVTVLAVERALAFSLANPAMKVLYTVVEPDEKYKAQSFVDTVVYRGGDAASGWIFNSLGKVVGLGPSAVAALTIPLALWWLALGLGLGRRLSAQSARPTAHSARS